MKPARPDLVIEPGDAASRVLVHVPHAGTAIPADIRVGIDLHQDELRHTAAAAADTHLDAVAHSAAYLTRPRPTLIINQLSRLVVDPDGGWTTPRRSHPLGLSVLTTTPNGAALRSADADEHAAITAAHLVPYRAAITAAIDQMRAIEPVDGPSVFTAIDLHATDDDVVTIALHDPIGLTLGVALEEFATDIDARLMRDDDRLASPHVIEPADRLITVRIDVPRRLLGRGARPHASSRALALALRRLIRRIEIAPRVDRFGSSTIRFVAGAPSALDGYVITAHNPFSQEQDARTDAEANAALSDALLAAGHEPLDVEAGADQWWESSLWVTGLTRDAACAFGARFDQFGIFEIADERLRVIDCSTQDVLVDDPLVVTRDTDVISARAGNDDGRNGT